MTEVRTTSGLKIPTVDERIALIDQRSELWLPSVSRSIRYVNLGIRDLVTYFKPWEELGFYALLKSVGQEPAIREDIERVLTQAGRYMVTVLGTQFQFDDPTFLSGIIRALNYLGYDPWDSIEGDIEGILVPEVMTSETFSSIYGSIPRRFKFSGPYPGTEAEREYEFEVIVPLRDNVESDGFAFGIETTTGEAIINHGNSGRIIGTSDADFYFENVGSRDRFILYAPSIGESRLVVTFNDEDFLRGYLKALLALQVGFEQIVIFDYDQPIGPNISQSMVDNYIETILDGYEINPSEDDIRLLYRLDIDGRSRYLRLTMDELNGLIISLDDFSAPPDIRLYEGKQYPEFPLLISGSARNRRHGYLEREGEYSLLGPFGYYRFDEPDFFRGYVLGAGSLGHDNIEMFRVFRERDPETLIATELLAGAYNQRS